MANISEQIGELKTITKDIADRLMPVVNGVKLTQQLLDVIEKPDATLDQIRGVAGVMRRTHDDAMKAIEGEE